VPVYGAPVRPSLVLSAALFACGCEITQGSPHLIDLVEVTPQRVGSGEHVEITGRGFPEGQRARLTFRGQLARAGAELEDVEISTFAQSASSRTLTFELDPRLEQEFCGETPVHTTFRGSVEAAFAARAPGAAPVTGELPEIVLDIVPQVSLDQAEARAREGARFAEFVGLVLQEDGRGLEVASVTPKSRAESAGVMAGDFLHELDGLRLVSRGDLVPAPGKSVSKLVVRRTTEKDPIALPLDARGFKPKSPGELTMLTGGIAALLVLALLLLSPFGRVLTWIERRIVHGFRERRSEQGPLSVQLFDRSTLAVSSELPSGTGPYLAIALALSAFAAIALDRSLVARELDLPIAYLTAVVMLVVARLLRRGADRATFTRRLHALGGFLLNQLALLLAVATPLAAIGSVRAFDIVASQGAAPYRYGLFQSPMALGAFFVFVAALLPRIERTPELATGRRRGASTLLDIAESLHTMVSCLLGALVFLGGYRLPFVSLATSALWISALGAAWFVLKAFLLYGLILVLRSGFGRFDTSRGIALTVRWLLPAGALSFALSLCWTRFGEKSPLSVVGPALGYASFAALCFLLLIVAQRVMSDLRRGTHEPGISPWL
jgi:NADH:ubiquinone oxidoreductase subunit H